jgi:hypothetical protein
MESRIQAENAVPLGSHIFQKKAWNKKSKEDQTFFVANNDSILPTFTVS